MEKIANRVFVDKQSEGCFATVVFAGCPFRCRQCLTPEAVATSSAKFSYKDILNTFMEASETFKKPVSFVELKGADPIFSPYLLSLVRDIKNMFGCVICLNTTGLDYNKFSEVFNHVDFIRFHLFGPFDKMTRFVGAKVNGERARDSIDLLLRNRDKTNYEVETLYHPWVYPFRAIREMYNSLDQLGLTRWTFKIDRGEKHNDPSLLPVGKQDSAFEERLRKIRKMSRYGSLTVRIIF